MMETQSTEVAVGEMDRDQLTSLIKDLEKKQSSTSWTDADRGNLLRARDRLSKLGQPETRYSSLSDDELLDIKRELLKKQNANQWDPAVEGKAWLEAQAELKKRFG